MIFFILYAPVFYCRYFNIDIFLKDNSERELIVVKDYKRREGIPSFSASYIELWCAD